MNCPIGTQGTSGCRPEGAEHRRTALALDAGRADGPLLGAAPATFEPSFDAIAGLALLCVWSDTRDDCSCRSRISRAIVEQAWRRELAASGDRVGRFFHLLDDDGVWQAYGIANGEVRGVYCPAHNSQRAARSRAAIFDAGDVVIEVALAA